MKFTFRDGARTRDLPAVAGDMDILPEHYYETVDFAESTLDPPLGSGAYEVAEVAPGKTVEYCRVPDYWGASHPASVGADNFDCYVYEYFSDSTAAFEALKAGEYLFHEEYFSKIWATEYDFPALGKGWVVKESLPDGRPSGTQGFWINMRRDKFADVRIRKALGLLFNFEWSNKTLFYGLYTRTDSFWENSGLQASGMAQGAERALLERHRALLPPEVFSEPAWTPPVSRPDRSDRKALRAASKLLDEAGWTLRDGLRRNAAGETLEVEILDDSPAFERIVNPYVENLRRAGIDARYSLVDPAQMQQRQEDFDYDVIPRPAGDVPDPGRGAGHDLRQPGGRYAGDPEPRGGRPSGGGRADRGGREGEDARGSERGRPAPWTGCCARCTSGSPTGTRRRTTSPIGTCSAAPPSSPPTPAACLPCGGSIGRSTIGSRPKARCDSRTVTPAS